MYTGVWRLLAAMPPPAVAVMATAVFGTHAMALLAVEKPVVAVVVVDDYDDEVDNGDDYYDCFGSGQRWKFSCKTRRCPCRLACPVVRRLPGYLSVRLAIRLGHRLQLKNSLSEKFRETNLQ